MAETRRRRAEYWAGLAGVATVVVVASLKTWPVPDGTAEASFVELLLGDRVLVGMLRLAIFAGAVYGIASIPALIVGGRWVKGLGTTGILVDDARAEADLAVEDSKLRVAALTARIERVARQVDEIKRMGDEDGQS